MGDKLLELALGCSFKAPSHWQCGTDLTVSDEIPAAAGSRRGKVGPLAALAGPKSAEDACPNAENRRHDRPGATTLEPLARWLEDRYGTEVEIEET